MATTLVNVTPEEMAKEKLTKDELAAIGKRTLDSASELITFVGYLNTPQKKLIEVQDENGNVIESKMQKVVPEMVMTKNGYEIPALERCVMRCDGINITWKSFRTREAAVLVYNLAISRQDHPDTRERYLFIIQTSSDAAKGSATVEFSRQDGSKGQRKVPTIELSYVNRVGVLALDHELPEKEPQAEQASA